jgi:hypothetical protein
MLNMAMLLKAAAGTANIQHVGFRGLSTVTGMHCRIHLSGSQDGIFYKPGCSGFLTWPYHEKFLKSIINPIENPACNTYRL